MIAFLASCIAFNIYCIFRLGLESCKRFAGDFDNRFAILVAQFFRGIQSLVHIRECQRPLQQRIVAEINLADRQIVGGAPVGIHLVEHLRGKSFSLHGSILLFSANVENAANHPGNHVFFVCSNHANRGPAGIRGNHSRILGIPRLVLFDAEEAQSIADARADE
jgi:hypothetical protein